jgi:hypothetical protein
VIGGTVLDINGPVAGRWRQYAENELFPGTSCQASFTPSLRHKHNL